MKVGHAIVDALFGQCNYPSLQRFRSTRAAVQERVGNFLHGLSSRREEVKRRCRTVLQSRAGRFLRESLPDPRCFANAHPTLALV